MLIPLIITEIQLQSNEISLYICYNDLIKQIKNLIIPSAGEDVDGAIWSHILLMGMQNTAITLENSFAVS